MKEKLSILFVFIILTVILVCITVFIMKDDNDVLLDEPTIEVAIGNKKVKAITNSYCDKKKCVDKLAPYEMSYDDIIKVRENEVIKVIGLEEEITRVEILLNSKEILTISHNDDDKTIIVPEGITGEYVVLIHSKHNYSFKINIIKVEDLNIVSLSEKFILDKLVSGDYNDFRLLKVLEYGYYPNKKNEKYVQLNFYVTCQNDNKCVKIAHKTDDISDYVYYSIMVKVKNNRIEFSEDGGFNSSVIQTHNVYMSVME